MNEWMNVSILIVPIPFTAKWNCPPSPHTHTQDVRTLKKKDTTYMYAPVKMKRTFFDKPHRERHLRFIIKMAKITHFAF